MTILTLTPNNLSFITVCQVIQNQNFVEFIGEEKEIYGAIGAFAEFAINNRDSLNHDTNVIFRVSNSLKPPLTLTIGGIVRLNDLINQNRRNFGIK